MNITDLHDQYPFSDQSKVGRHKPQTLRRQFIMLEQTGKAMHMPIAYCLAHFLRELGSKMENGIRHTNKVVALQTSRFACALTCKRVRAFAVFSCLCSGTLVFVDALRTHSTRVRPR